MSMTKTWIGPMQEERKPYEHIATLKIIVGGGPKMQKSLIFCSARKGFGGPMEVAFDAVEGQNDSEREAKMLAQIEQVRLGVSENYSMTKLSDHFKGALQ